MDDKPKRRSFRFSLKTLLVLVALAAIFPGTALYRAERQRQAVEHLRSTGAQVKYEYQMTNGSHDANAPMPGPAWLINLFGVDLVADIDAVEVGRPTWPARDRFTNEDLGRLGALSTVRFLDISYSNTVTDDGLRPIRRFEQLESLNSMVWAARLMTVLRIFARFAISDVLPHSECHGVERAAQI